MKTMLDEIDKLRIDAGLTQDRLAELAHLAKNRISKWKSGQGEPGASEIARMARVLGVPPGRLFGEPQVGSGEEAEILKLARDLGYSVAKNRLMLRPDDAGAYPAEMPVRRGRPIAESPPSRPSPSGPKGKNKKRA